MRVLVLGGTGITGPYAVKRLVNGGHDVTVFHRGQHKADLPNSVTQIHGDKDDLASFAQQFRALAPDVVLNAVCFTDQDARAFVKTFQGVARRAVVISSIDVHQAFGWLHCTEPNPPDPPQAPPAPLTEDTPKRTTLSAGGADYDKLAVERITMDEPSLPTTTLRFPSIYGPRDGHRFYRWVKRMDDGRNAIPIGPDFARLCFSYAYAENIAIATVLAVTQERATGRIYNVAEVETLPWDALIKEIGRAAGWHGQVVVRNYGESETPRAIYHVNVDSSRIRNELGYREEVSLQEGLRRTIDWYRANPPAIIDPKDFDYAAEDEQLRELAG